METKELFGEGGIPFKVGDKALGRHNAYVGQLVANPEQHPNLKVNLQPEDILATGIITKLHIEEGYHTFRAEVLISGQIIHCFNYQLRSLEESCQKQTLKRVT